MTQRFGQIELNGGQFRIEISSYRGRDIVDFSPRSQVPGIGAIYNELSLYQVILQTDWSGGFGFQWHTSEAGYLRTTGRVDTRHAGVAMLWTNETSSDTDQNEKYNFLVTRIAGVNKVWAAHNSGLRYWTSGLGWTDVSPVAATKVNQVWWNGKYVFALVDGDRPYYTAATTDPVVTTDWTAAGADSDAIDYKWLSHHDGFVYAGKDADDSGTAGNEVYYDDSIILADLHGTPASDPTVIYVGIDGWPTKGGFSFQGDIYVPKAEGLFRINKDKTTVTKVLDFSDVASSVNFRSWAVFNGAVYFPIRDVIYRWNGVSLANVTPPRLTDSFPYKTYGTFDNFVVVGSFLLMTAEADDSTGVYDLDVLAFDGATWHKLATIIAGSGSTTGTAYAMHYDVLNDYLWLTYYNNGTATWHTGYIPFRSRSPFPYGDFPTSGTHSLITSRIDAGFRRVKKSSPSLLVEASNLTKDQQYLKIYYSIDGGSWTAWGGIDGETNIIWDNGITELSNPLGPHPSTLEYYHIQLRVDFVTTLAAETPVLEALALRMILRPKVAYGYSFTVVCSEEAELGLAQDTRSTRTIIQLLHDARDSKSPVLFKDPYGDEHHVYISSINELAVETRGGEDSDMGPYPEIEGRVVVNVVEVG